MTIPTSPNPDPLKAWTLLNRLQDLANELWEAFDPQFTEFVLMEMNQPPDDDFPDPDFGVDDIPF